jgi:hypothetical protein
MAQVEPGQFHPHPGHDAGMAVDYLFDVKLPISEAGELTPHGQDVLRLVRKFEQVAWNGPEANNDQYLYKRITLHEVRVTDPVLAVEINRGRVSPVAVFDESLAFPSTNAVSIQINPPPVMTFAPPATPVIGEEVRNGFQEVLDWLSKLVDFECDCSRLPALVEASLPEDGADDSSDGSVSIASVVGVSNVLSGSPLSLSGILDSITGDGELPDIYQLADEFTGNQVDWFLRLPRATALEGTQRIGPSEDRDLRFCGQSVHDALVTFSEPRRQSAKAWSNGGSSCRSPAIKFGAFADSDAQSPDRTVGRR